MSLTFLIWLLSPEPVDIISMLIVKIEWDLKIASEEILIIQKTAMTLYDCFTV